MPRLLSGSTLRRGGSGEFLDLKGAMPQLPESPSTSTGFTLVTNNLLQTTYRSSLGNIEFNNSSLYSGFEDGIVRVLSTGTTSAAISENTATFVVEGGIGVTKNIWTKEDITVNDLIIGQGYEGINNIVFRGNAVPQEDDFLNGQENIAIGYDTLMGLDTAYKNIAIGRFALSSGTELSNSIAIGDSSLKVLGSTGTSQLISIAGFISTPPINIVQITNENPAKVITVAHGFVNGEKIFINESSGFEISGTSLVNGRSFWVKYISPTEFYLYQESDLIIPLDATAASAYSGNGKIFKPMRVGTLGSHNLNSNDEIKFFDVIGFDDLNYLKFYVEQIDNLNFYVYSDPILNTPVTGIGYSPSSGKVTRLLKKQSNIGIGVDTGKKLIDGSKNIFFGYKAGTNLTTGSNNIIIGHETGRFVYTGSGIISLGGDNIVNGIDNQVNIGSVFYFDGQGNTDLNTDVTLGLGSESTNSDTGALVVTGGVGIKGNLNVDGETRFLNTTIFYQNILPGVSGLTIGDPTNRFKSIYLEGTTLYLSTVTVQSLNGQDFRIESPDGSVTQTVGSLRLTSGEVSSDAYTGALVITGGLGVSDDVHINGQLVVNGTRDVYLTPDGATVEIMPTNGGTVTIHPSGNTSRIDNIIIGSENPLAGNFTTLTAINTLTSITSSTGQSVEFSGGLGVKKDVYVDGGIYNTAGNPYENNLVYAPMVHISAGVPPANPRVGDVWIDSTIPAYLQYIQDGTNRIWVQIGSV